MLGKVAKTAKGPRPTWLGKYTWLLSDDTAADPAAPAGHVDGRLNLQDFEEATGLVLPRGSSDTIAGFITERLGRLAVVGDTVDIPGATIRVASMDRRRIAGVHVTARSETETAIG